MRRAIYNTLSVVGMANKQPHWRYPKQLHTHTHAHIHTHCNRSKMEAQMLASDQDIQTYLDECVNNVCDKCELAVRGHSTIN
jgi:hypothetical protein